MGIIYDGNDLVQLMTGSSLVGLDDIVAAKTNAGTFALQQITSWKDPMVAGAAASTTISGIPVSTWQYQGTPICHGAVPPTTWANPTRATQGALGQNDPFSGRVQRIIDAVGALIGTPGVIMIYDRLGHVSGMSGTVTTAQNVNSGFSGAVTRFGSATNNFLAYEIYTSVGATATTITASYTNQGSTAGQITQPVTIGGANRANAQFMGIMSLAAGDTGVLAVLSATVLATTGTAGNFGLTIGQPLYALACGGINQTIGASFVNAPLSALAASGSCLSMMFVPAVGGVNPAISLFLEIAEK